MRLDELIQVIQCTKIWPLNKALKPSKPSKSSNRFRISANQNTSPGYSCSHNPGLWGRAGPSTSALRMRVRMLLLFLVQSIAIECDLCKVMQVYNPYLLVKWCCIFSSMSMFKACCIPWICDTVDRTSGCLWYQPGELGPQLSWRCWTRYQTL